MSCIKNTALNTKKNIKLMHLKNQKFNVVVVFVYFNKNNRYLF